MPDIPALTDSDFVTAKARIRAAWQREYPTSPLPDALAFAERGIEAITLAEGNYTGLLVALWLDPAQAAQLAIDGGEAADQLHVTLCYVPDMADTDDVTWARVIAAQADVAASYRELTGKVSGYGRFAATGTSDGQDVFWALPEIDGIEWFRESVQRAMLQAGVYDGGDARYWIPHITLAYLAPKAKTPAAPPMIDLAFGGITIVAGNRRVNIPFYNQQGTEYVGVFEPSYYIEHSHRKPKAGKAKEAWRFSTPVRLADADKWIQVLPAPGTYYHAYYGTLTFTADRYERMLDNFTNQVYSQTLPVNAEHDLDASGALGWVTDMRIAADGSLEVKADWNDRGQALIDGDRFRYVSAEWWEEWQDPVSGQWISDVFSGFAICTHPHFKTDVLRPLAASEIAASAQFGEQSSIAHGEQSPEETIGMSEAEKTITPPAEAVQFNEADAKAFREFQSLGGAAKLTELSEAVTKLSERNSALEADARKKRFTDIVRGRAEGSDGAQWRGDVDRHVAHMTQLAEAFGDDSQMLKDYIADRTADAMAFAEATKDLLKPIGTGRGGDDAPTALERIDQMAKELAEKEGITFHEARAKVADQNPKLFTEAREGK
jgi:2'-5' RNA ligase